MQGVMVVVWCKGTGSAWSPWPFLAGGSRGNGKESTVDSYGGQRELGVLQYGHEKQVVKISQMDEKVAHLPWLAHATGNARSPDKRKWAERRGATRDAADMSAPTPDARQRGY
jgi:hypothetical protein